MKWNFKRRDFIKILALGIMLLPMGLLGADQLSSRPLLRFAFFTDIHAMIDQDIDQRDREKTIKRYHQMSRLIDRSFPILEGATKFMKEGLKADFIICGGDLVENGGWKSGLETMRKCKEIIDSHNLPCLYTFGNHEVNRKKFGEILGPLDYSVQVGNLDFIFLPMRHWFEGVPKSHPLMTSLKTSSTRNE